MKRLNYNQVNITNSLLKQVVNILIEYYAQLKIAPVLYRQILMDLSHYQKSLFTDQETHSLDTLKQLLALQQLARSDQEAYIRESLSAFDPAIVRLYCA